MAEVRIARRRRANIVNTEPDDVPMLAIRGQVDDTGNATSPAASWSGSSTRSPSRRATRCSNHGRGQMLDHMLITHNLLANRRGSEIHNETLHDESVAFDTNRSYPESAKPRLWPSSTSANCTRIA
jgi:hypothetical protein